MEKLREIPVRTLSVDRFEPIVGEGILKQIHEAAAVLRDRLDGRTVWTFNSTDAGGGVAEMLRSLLAYCRGLGVDARWLVVSGSQDFFRVTKRLHNALHGSRGDGSSLGEDARALYEAIQEENAAELEGLIRPGDVAIVHDPQPAGLIARLFELGARVIWRCHIGGDPGNPEVAGAWEFLRPYVSDAHAFVFSRRAYVPPFCDEGRTVIIHPSIDPFSAKNQDMEANTVRAILVESGLIQGPNGHAAPTFLREDGTVDRIARKVDLLSDEGPPAGDEPLVVQVSRWDGLKDPIGVLQGFARFASSGRGRRAELVLAGPCVAGVADDPEGAATYERTAEAWRGLPAAVRRRVHLAAIPMHDLEENAAIVNALQRHAAVVVQKSLQEGFGLTVTEAMWKSRPVIASAVGGIQDQIQDGVHGLLVRDPSNLDAFASALRKVLSNRRLGDRLSESARARVKDRFLGLRALMQYSGLIDLITR